MLTLAGVAVTLLDVLACVVVYVSSDGVVVGYNLNARLGLTSCVSVRRAFKAHVKLPNEFGSVLSADWLARAHATDVNARCKGKGFAGVIKRHGFSGLRASHGVSLAHRACGAIGSRQDPGRVWKGTKMAGRLGGGFVTLKRVKVVALDSFCQRVTLKGPVPGGSRACVRLTTRCSSRLEAC
ncbi:putative 50S ribosomal subunit protein L3 [Candidatus Hodgkinia cicadicola Dsem]|nr:putative 50S ribosomal subunit protein L3 [Candidatus Hodgkinia cicadicola Dsem]